MWQPENLTDNQEKTAYLRHGNMHFLNGIKTFRGLPRPLVISCQITAPHIKVNFTGSFSDWSGLGQALRPLAGAVRQGGDAHLVIGDST